MRSRCTTAQDLVANEPAEVPITNLYRRRETDSPRVDFNCIEFLLQLGLKCIARAVLKRGSGLKAGFQEGETIRLGLD